MLANLIGRHSPYILGLPRGRGAMLTPGRAPSADATRTTNVRYDQPHPCGHGASSSAVTVPPATSIPQVSSPVSRTAACQGVSPTSIAPPNVDQVPPAATRAERWLSSTQARPSGVTDRGRTPEPRQRAPVAADPAVTGTLVRHAVLTHGRPPFRLAPTTSAEPTTWRKQSAVRGGILGLAVRPDTGQQRRRQVTVPAAGCAGMTRAPALPCVRATCGDAQVQLPARRMLPSALTAGRPAAIPGAGARGIVSSCRQRHPTLALRGIRGIGLRRRVRAGDFPSVHEIRRPQPGGPPICKRLSRLAAAAAMTGLLTAGAIAASTVAASASTTFASCSAQGDYAVCDASGTATNPIAIIVSAASSPDQDVYVTWDAVCSQGTGAGSSSGSFTAETPVSRTISHPYYQPDSCTVAAGAQLQAGGTASTCRCRTRGPPRPQRRRASDQGIRGHVRG